MESNPNETEIKTRTNGKFSRVAFVWETKRHNLQLPPDMPSSRAFQRCQYDRNGPCRVELLRFKVFEAPLLRNLNSFVCCIPGPCNSAGFLRGSPYFDLLRLFRFFKRSSLHLGGIFSGDKENARPYAARLWRQHHFMNVLHLAQ